MLNRTSKPTELLLSIDRDDGLALGRQLEDQLRTRIRDGALRAGAPLPSTRDLARQLGVSRGLIVNAYAQLSAEGYLVLRQGTRPRVSEIVIPRAENVSEVAPPKPARFDFRPSAPDVSAFPRAAWSRSLRHAIAVATDADLGYGDLRGVHELHLALADYLGRSRGAVVDPGQIVITSGYTQAVGLVCRALARSGAKRIAVENPSDPEQRETAARAGLEVLPVSVDGAGARVDEVRKTRADALIASPAHQFPTGAVMPGERRAELLAWLRTADAVVIEDDYDAEYRYDRAPVGSLQGLEPDRVIYAGSASKVLAPALRLGWLVVPPRLLDAVTREKHLADRGTARLEQYAFADFLGRGELERHLRRMRAWYRARRDLMLDALAEALPETAVQGIDAGLHATLRLLDGDDERAIVAEAGRRGIALESMSEYSSTNRADPPTLLIGYGQSPEASIPPGIEELASVIRMTRSSGPG